MNIRAREALKITQNMSGKYVFIIRMGFLILQ
jgi:hypothetical protein